MNYAAAAKSIQSCPTLCDPIDSSPPGSPVPGILQARVLEWGAIAFSNNEYYTAHLLKWLRLKRPKDLCGSLDGREVCREWIRVYIAESLCCSPETITTLLISYIPIQNKKFKRKKTNKQKDQRTNHTKCWQGCGRTRTLHIPLVGMYAILTLENSLTVS